MQYYFQKIYLLLIAFMLYTVTFAQQAVTGYQSLAPMKLEITDAQTSVLIFPTAIKSVDRGNGNILTKTVKNVSNVLKVKAANTDFAASNLHVFTSDGKVYPFRVEYHSQPQHLTIDLTGSSSQREGQSVVEFNPERLNDADIAGYAEKISMLKSRRHNPHSKWVGKARLSLHGIYYIKGVLFFHFSIVNRAPVPYHIDFSRSYIRDRKKNKRTSVTEEQVQPLYLLGDTGTVLSEPTHMVLAFDQFTIANDKYLFIEVFERNGDRLLSCKLKGKDILRAKEIEAASFEAGASQ